MHNKKKQICTFSFLLISNIVLAQPVSKPKIIIGVVIDQMRWDYLYRYQNGYCDNGFNRLLHKGFNCQNTYLNYVPSYTAPGHASIYTGSVPAIHGIVGNDWRTAKNSSHIYCASDSTVQGIGGSQKAGMMSPHAMKTTTIGDELRLASNFRSRVYGIAMKDRGAIFPAGHTANGAFWYDDSTGNFISSSFYGKELPSWLVRFNAQKWATHFLKDNWETLYPIASYTQSIADNNDFEELSNGESKPTFPHLVPANKFESIREIPAGNTLSFLLAKTLIKEEKLGLKNETDMLCISLSTPDYIGHNYAPNSVEVEDMYLRLDEEMASFLHFLDAQFGKENYTLFVTADHGAAHNSVFLEEHKIPSGVFSAKQFSTELNQFITTKFHVDGLISSAMNYQIFLNEVAIEKNKLDRSKIKEAVIDFCKKQNGIATVFDLENLGMLALPDIQKTAIVNGYYPQRCGAVGFLLEPAWYSGGKKGTTHGTWNPYDTHIPLLWYGWGIPKGETFERYEVTDIAATIGALLYLQVPNGSVGKVIKFQK